jgi:hypothetical protein
MMLIRNLKITARVIQHKLRLLEMRTVNRLNLGLHQSKARLIFMAGGKTVVACLVVSTRVLRTCARIRLSGSKYIFTIEVI